MIDREWAEKRHKKDMRRIRRDALIRMAVMILFAVIAVLLIRFGVG